MELGADGAPSKIELGADGAWSKMELGARWTSDQMETHYLWYVSFTHGDFLNNTLFRHHLVPRLTHRPWLSQE